MAIMLEPISPIAFSILGFQIRWYALAYIAGFVFGFWMLKKLVGANENSPVNATDSRANFHSPLQTKKAWDDLMAAVILGVIIGGRLGYVLFYNLPFFIENPMEIFMLWHGGMSFHGGLLGVIVSVFLFASRTKTQKQSAECRVQSAINNNASNNCTLHTAHCTLQNAFSILDAMSIVAPIGLFFGRIANFINMEVMGRATDGPLGVVFIGNPDQTPRYPSPLFEAGMEGSALFIIMFCLWKFTRLRERAGALSGAFAMLYAAFRIIGEQFRQPDVQLGFIAGGWLTMGMLLSGVMFIAGAAIFAISFRKSHKCSM